MSRTALVTGGASGIGQGIAIALANAGFDIAIVSLETSAESETAIEGVKRHGRRAFFIQHDIAQIDAFPTLIEGIHSELGPIDCLVNNAGVSSLRRGDLLDVAQPPTAAQLQLRDILPDAGRRATHDRRRRVIPNRITARCHDHVCRTRKSSVLIS
jgi:NAD(P)-dependent dehydrogenase (short-subunit alcohol dehydrogenase family)